MVKIVGKIELEKQEETPVKQQEIDKTKISQGEILLSEKNWLYVLDRKGFGVPIHKDHLKKVKLGEVWKFMYEKGRYIPLEIVYTAEQYKEMNTNKVEKLVRKYKSK